MRKLLDTLYDAAAWLAALERLLIAKGVASGAELRDLAEAWRAAAEATPHGQPIVLDRE